MRVRGLVRLAGAAGIALLAAPAWCQPGDVLDITGRDFAGIRLPAATTSGRIEFGASRVATWTEQGEGPPVRRLLLAGDVQITLGLYRFSAARALVWLSALPDSDPDAGPGVHQVYVYFDRVGTPTADAAVAVSADRLAVQGVFRVIESVVLRGDALTEGRPDEAFVREGERQLASTLRQFITGEPAPLELATPGEPGGPAPGRRLRPTPLRPGVSQPYAPESEEQIAERIADVQRRLAPAERPEPVFARDGVLTIASGRVTIAGGPDETTLVVTSDERSPVTIVYWDRSRGRTLQLTAEQVVVFLDPGSLTETAQFEISDVRGLYLEGDVVADDGQYTIRAPKVYYSMREDRAYLVDAVFWTHTGPGSLPLYVRARAIEQQSRDKFKATGARLTNTAFFDPFLSLGVSTVTIERVGTEERRTIVDARDITLRAGGLPFFYFPRFRGDPAAIPLRGLGFGNSSRTGGVITTAWDAYGLLGLDPGRDTSIDLLLDAYFERGLGIGLDVDWGTERTSGGLFAYALPDDTGEDLTSSGVRLEREGEFRGMVLADHTAKLGEHWTLQLQGAYLSDETFVDALFNPLARTRREFENSAYVKRADDQSVFTTEFKGTFNDFTANQYLQQTPGYTVQRVPEAGYARLADDLLPESAPGLLTYSSEYRLGRLALNFTDPTAAEMGFTRPGQSQAAFGILPNQSIADSLRAQGFTEDWVTRFDTRHEISMQMLAGPVNIMPFIVGRLTAWDRDFRRFSPDADQRERLWGATGVRVGTEMQRVDNRVESRLFDLHRIRHIVAPSVTVWTAGTTIDRQDLPVYDEGVESIAEGTAVRLAVDQTWQTQRGGPGRWRSVDVFKLSAEAVVSSGDVDTESPIGRFFDYRPELSNLGDYGTLDATWQVSEAVALGTATVYDFDLQQQARTSAGTLIQHTPEFSTFADIRYINSQNQTFVNLGAQYELTPKYSLSGFATYDTERGDIQFISTELRRAFPNMVLGIAATYNDVTGETSFGFVLQPLGVPGGRTTFQGMGTGGPVGRAASVGG